MKQTIEVPYLEFDTEEPISLSEEDDDFLGDLLLICDKASISFPLNNDVTLSWAKKFAEQLKLPLYANVSDLMRVGG